MTQLERLQEWYAKTVVVTTLVAVPTAQRVNACVNNPSRIFLGFFPDINPGDWQLIPLGKFCTSLIPMIPGGYTDSGLQLELEKHYALVTSGWDVNSPGGLFNLIVVEVLYQG